MKVLLANDQSPRAVAAAHLLARLPFREPTAATLISVVDVPQLPRSVESHARWPEILDLMLKDAEQSNTDVADALGPNMESVESVVCRGNPASEILLASSPTDADPSTTDLVVLGALGHSTLQRLMLGSVSDRVATHSECSTLVVRPAVDEAATAGPLKIVIAYDGSDPAKAALNEIIQLDWSPETEITLLHVLTPASTPYYTGLGVDMAGLWETELSVAQNSLDHAAALFRPNGPKVTVEVRTADHHGEAICERANERSADIIVVGDHGFGGFKRFLLGSVSRYVLRHAKTSVWISRPPNSAA